MKRQLSVAGITKTIEVAAGVSRFGGDNVNLHLLGQSSKGDAILAACRKETDMPLVGNYSRIRSILTHHYGKGSEKLRLAQEMLAWEIKATRTYTLLMKRWQGGNRNLDFFNNTIRIA